MLNIVRKLGLAAVMLWSLCTEASARPNIAIILVDDAGFMDFGGYGGEARTPNIDQLADEGVRFSNYHTSPLCATSRAMLLTGLDSHKTGVATIPEVATKEQQASPSYSLRLLPGVRTLADILGESGYQTYMTGKWHLGNGKEGLPNSHGFDRSFALDASGADNWEQKSFMPFYEEAPWFEDGEAAILPEDFYSSQFLVDKMLDYLDSRDRTRPFLAYLAFQAIHIPVQAPREFTDHYEGVYTEGWEATLSRRFEHARSLGLVPPDAASPGFHPLLRPWNALTPREKLRYEHAMMVNAGMIEAMDYHIGRLIAYLKANKEFDNTVFIITSDNGPEFGDPTTDPIFRLWMLANGYHNNPERAGERGYMGAIGPEWASAAAVPGSLFKMYASEGGTRVPLIVRVPGISADGFNGALSFVTDVAPTIVELAGLDGVGEMDGKSLLPVLTGQKSGLYAADEPVGLEVAGNAALFKGDFKLTRNTLPHGDARWRLHDLYRDPAELRDLSADLPELRRAMLEDYERYAEAVGVVALPDEFDVQAQIGVNARKRMLSRYLAWLIGTGMALLLVLLAIVFLVRERRRRAGR